MATHTITLDGIVYTVSDPYTVEALRLLVLTHPIDPRK